jgi:hypothetical protein
MERFGRCRAYQPLPRLNPLPRPISCDLNGASTTSDQEAQLRGMIYGFAAVLALTSAPGLSQAAVYAHDHCQVVVPDGWVASKTRIASADKLRWASLMSAPTAAEIIQMEKGLGAKPVSDSGGITLMSSTASYGGLTNVQFHAISHTSPACIADVTVRAGADEALATQIALTVKPAK